MARFLCKEGTRLARHRLPLPHRNRAGASFHPVNPVHPVLPTWNRKDAYPSRLVLIGTLLQRSVGAALAPWWGRGLVDRIRGAFLSHKRRSIFAGLSYFR